MELFHFLLIITVIHSVLFFFDSIFKSCMHYPYDAFLRGTGFDVKFFRLQWHTTVFNRTVVKWSTSFPKLLSLSFNIGVYISVFLLPIAFVILFLSTVHTNDSTDEKRQSNSGIKGVKMEFMLPGVNLPIDEIIYYIIALAISSVVHEFGHAMAGVMEDVPLIEFGFFIFLFIPIAYTNVGNDQLNNLKMWKKLKLLCAGIWHNILLAFLGYLIFSLIPFLSIPFYELNKSVVVKDIKINSPVYGARGLQHGDVITKINDCKVYNLDSWYGCLLESIQYQPAYCVSTDFVHQNDESVQSVQINDGLIDCCDTKNIAASCFEYISDSNYGELELPQHMCLNIRKTIENSNSYCHKINKCDKNFCIKPLMNNLTTILEVSKNYLTNSMIYIGHPADLYQNVKVSEFVPKTKYFSPELADSIGLLIKYISVLSLGLATVNIIPCFGTDGQHILNTILNQILHKKVPKKRNRELISLSFTILGTLLISINFIKIFLLPIFKFLIK